MHGHTMRSSSTAYIHSLASAGYLFISAAAGLRNEHAIVYKGDFYSGHGKDIEI